MELRKSTERKGQIYEPSGQGSNRSRVMIYWVYDMEHGLDSH